MKSTAFLKWACCLILIVTADIAFSKGLDFHAGLALGGLLLAVWQIIEEEIAKWEPLP